MYIIMKASDGFQIQLDLEKFKRLQVILERKFDDIVNKEHVGGNLYMFKLATKLDPEAVVLYLISPDQNMSSQLFFNVRQWDWMREQFTAICSRFPEIGDYITCQFRHQSQLTAMKCVDCRGPEDVWN